MPASPVQVRTATAAEVEDAVGTIVAAFVTDPITRFIWPNPHTYLASFTRAAGVMTAPAFEHGSAFITEGFQGAALWIPPGIHADPEPLGSLLVDTVAEDRLEDIGATLDAMGAAHPEAPHWYLPFIGVDPFAQGRGIGAALMKHAVTRWDAEGAIAHLESSNPRNISLYERFGFEATGEIQCGRAPLVTPMVRHPH